MSQSENRKLRELKTGCGMLLRKPRKDRDSFGWRVAIRVGGGTVVLGPIVARLTPNFRPTRAPGR